MRNARPWSGLVAAVALVVVAGAISFRLGFEGAAALAQQATAAPTTDVLAIDFEAVDLEGRPYHGIELKGKVVLLDFWAVWCAPCIDAFPKLTRLARDLDGEPFALIGLALYSGDHEAVRSFLEPYTADYTVVVGDDELAFRYGVIGYPTYLLIDQHGGVVTRYVGAVDDIEERIKADVRALIAAHESEPLP